MFGNRICWRYHCPSIHYYQTINYYLHWIKSHKFDRKQLNHIFASMPYFNFSITTIINSTGIWSMYVLIDEWEIHMILDMNLNTKKIISFVKIAYKKVVLIPFWHENLIHMKNGRSHISVQITRPYVIIPNKNLSCVQFYVSYQIKV